MKIIQTIEQWSQSINNGKVIALFTADWCPDCQVIKPDLPDIEAAFPSYTFITINRDDFFETAQDYAVMGIPSFLVFHNGEEVGRFVSKNRKTKEEIIAFISGLPN